MGNCLPFQQKVADEIRLFLEQDTWKVILLSGQWGTGKTYLVRDQFLGGDDCVYVSLYGAKSLDELRSRIAATWMLASIGSQNGTSDSNSKWLGGKLWGKAKSKFSRSEGADDLIQIGAGALPHSYERLASVGLWALLHTRKVRTLILDDLERKQESLKIGELFGFADFVSEKSGVQVIFIGNLEKLASEPGSSVREELGIEKVVSHEIRLKPDVDSIANIAVSTAKFPDRMLEPLRIFCSKAAIDNIRLLKRAVEHIDRFFLVVDRAGLNEVVDDSEVVRSYLGLIFARFSDEFGLQWDEARALCDVGVLPEFLRSKPERSRDAVNFAQTIGFPNVSYPELLTAHVESGLLDGLLAVRRLKELRDSVANRRSVNDSTHWTAIWDAYGNSMSENDEEIVQLIRAFLQSDSELLEIRSYHQLKSLAEAVGEDISGYEKDVHLRNVEHCPREELPRLLDHYRGEPEIESAVRARIDTEISVRSISDLARKALNDRGWSEADTYEIFARSEDEIRAWLLQEEEDKPDLVQQVITMDKQDVVRQLISDLARDSKLNEMRAEKIYRIESE